MVLISCIWYEIRNKPWLLNDVRKQKFVYTSLMVLFKDKRCFVTIDDSVHTDIKLDHSNQGIILVKEHT